MIDEFLLVIHQVGVALFANPSGLKEALESLDFIIDEQKATFTLMGERDSIGDDPRKLSLEEMLNMRSRIERLVVLSLFLIPVWR